MFSSENGFTDEIFFSESKLQYQFILSIYMFSGYSWQKKSRSKFQFSRNSILGQKIFKFKNINNTLVTHRKYTNIFIRC